MTDRELMQQALAALNDCHAFLEHDVPTANSGPERRAAAKAITALRERLEQPEQCTYPDCKCGSTNPNLHSAECFEDYEKATGMSSVEHAVIAGALFDFMGWLTSRKERIVLSSADNASPAVEAITEFAKMRSLSLDDAKVRDWQKRLEQPLRTHWEGCDEVHPECKKPEQEPVAWVDESAIRWLADRKGKVSAHCTTKLSAARSFEQWMPLYTAPPQRKPLTDEEIERACVPLDAAMLSFTEVAWMDDYNACKCPDNEARCFSDKVFRMMQKHTTPPQRNPWVGLTEEEIIDVLHPLVMADMSDEATDYEIARAIEAKLKEKNNA